MTSEAVYAPRTLSERIDWWISLKNWSWMSAMHRLVYRLSGGRLGGEKRGIPVLILNTVGRRSGKLRNVPLMYLQHDNGLVVVGSNAGLDHDPGWCFNLRSNPETTIQIGDEIVHVRARELRGAERARLWPRVVKLNPFYGGYQRRTSRQIPLMFLEPELKGSGVEESWVRE